MRLQRTRVMARTWNVLMAGACLSLAGCEPKCVPSVNGLVEPRERPEPFDARFVGEWYGPTWEAVEWKVERLLDTDRYFITHFDQEGKRTFFTASVVKEGELKLLDLQEAPAKGHPAGPHVLMKVERRRNVGFGFGTPGTVQAKMMTALGGGVLVRYKTLTLRPLRNRYFLDHPGLVDTKKTFDDEGRPRGLMLTATPKDLRMFFLAHGADEGLWADDETAVNLGSKLNPGDL